PRSPPGQPRLRGRHKCTRQGSDVEGPSVHFRARLPQLPPYYSRRNRGIMNRRMPRPEDVSHDHIDTTVTGFLRGEKDIDWTEVSLVTLHPREEIRIVLGANADRYRSISEGPAMGARSNCRQLLGRS